MELNYLVIYMCVWIFEFGVIVVVVFYILKWDKNNNNIGNVLMFFILFLGNVLICLYLFLIV